VRIYPSFSQIAKSHAVASKTLMQRVFVYTQCLLDCYLFIYFHSFGCETINEINNTIPSFI